MADFGREVILVVIVVNIRTFLQEIGKKITRGCNPGYRVYYRYGNKS